LGEFHHFLQFPQNTFCPSILHEGLTYHFSIHQGLTKLKKIGIKSIKKYESNPLMDLIHFFKILCSVKIGQFPWNNPFPMLKHPFYNSFTSLYKCKCTQKYYAYFNKP
jgi:hypothetical protein